MKRNKFFIIIVLFFLVKQSFFGQIEIETSFEGFNKKYSKKGTDIFFVIKSDTVFITKLDVYKYEIDKNIKSIVNTIKEDSVEIILYTKKNSVAFKLSNIKKSNNKLFKN
jgi:hypothetical protein